jgi:predicted acyl esterase
MPPPVQTYCKPIKHPKIGENGYAGFKTHTEVLPKGWQMRPGNSRALPCAIVADHHTQIVMRDGCRIYCDIYRPHNAEKVPAILAWSPYG